MTRNPTLRKYHTGLLKGAINENSVAVGKNLKGLSKELEKEDPDLFDELTSQNDANKQSD